MGVTGSPLDKIKPSRKARARRAGKSKLSSRKTSIATGNVSLKPKRHQTKPSKQKTLERSSQKQKPAPSFEMDNPLGVLKMFDDVDITKFNSSRNIQSKRKKSRKLVKKKKKKPVKKAPSKVRK